MVHDRRREHDANEEGSWGEEDRRQRDGRSGDWLRRNDDSRRRDGRPGRHEGGPGGYARGGFGRGFEDYGQGRDAYGSGGDHEQRAEMGRGYGQGSFGENPNSEGALGPAGRYGYGYGGSAGMGSGRHYGYGAEGWRSSDDHDRDWQQGGQHSRHGREYGSGEQRGGVFGFAAGSSRQGHQHQHRGQHAGQQRGMWDRASDEVSSWLGDDEAQHRREMDHHRGKGPKNYARSDERIKEDVCDHLAEHPMVDASEVDVTVQNGEVTLGGTVSSRREKRAAEGCVERISGITHLQNNLRVQASQSSAQSSAQSGAMGRSTGSMAGTTTGGTASIGSGRSSSTSAAGSDGSIERK